MLILKELRKINGYTQEYVASYLGVVRQTYSFYETGNRKPSAETLYKLSKLYNISIDDLMESAVEKENEYSFYSNLEIELLYFFKQISDDDKKEIIEFVKIKANKHK